MERDEHMKSKVDYFPFVSGELLEQHRSELSGKMRADLQNYLIAKSQGLVGGPSKPNRTTQAKMGGSSVSSQGMYSLTDGSVVGCQVNVTVPRLLFQKYLNKTHTTLYQTTRHQAAFCVGVGVGLTHTI